MKKNIYKKIIKPYRLFITYTVLLYLVLSFLTVLYPSLHLTTYVSITISVSIGIILGLIKFKKNQNNQNNSNK